MKEGIDCGYTLSATPSSVAPFKLSRFYDFILLALGWRFWEVYEALAQIFRDSRVKPTYEQFRHLKLLFWTPEVTKLGVSQYCLKIFFKIVLPSFSSNMWHHKQTNPPLRLDILENLFFHPSWNIPERCRYVARTTKWIRRRASAELFVWHLARTTGTVWRRTPVNATMDTRADTVKSVNDLENFMLMEKYSSHLSDFTSFPFCLMSKNRFAAGRHSVRTERLRAGRTARRGCPSDGARTCRAGGEGVVLAKDSVL